MRSENFGWSQIGHGRDYRPYGSDHTLRREESGCIVGVAIEKTMIVNRESPKIDADDDAKAMNNEGGKDKHRKLQATLSKIVHIQVCLAFTENFFTKPCAI